MKKCFILVVAALLGVITWSCKDDDEKTVAVTGVTVSESSVSIVAGTTKNVTATVTPENAADKTVKWASDNPAIATVADGTITAVAVGTATVTVTSNADATKKAIVAVTVTANVVNVESVTVTESTMLIVVGDDQPITYTVLPANATNKTVEWASDNTAVATVEAGVVTAVAKGTATITVTSGADATKKATVAVTVTEIEVTEVTVDVDEVNLEVGDHTTVEATVLPENATNIAVKWESDNTAVATVVNGVITAVAEGTATITVTSLSDDTKTATVTVNVILGALVRTNWIATTNGVLNANDNGDRALFDGNEETIWAYHPPSSGEFTLTIDTRGSKSITAIKVLLSCNNKITDVSVSADGAVWQPAGTINSVNDCGLDEHTLQFTNAVTARYIRLTSIEQVWPGGYNSIAEFNVFGELLEDEDTSIPSVPTWADRSLWTWTSTGTRNENYDEAAGAYYDGGIRGLFDGNASSGWAWYPPTGDLADGIWYITVDMQSAQAIQTIKILSICNNKVIGVSISSNNENWESLGTLNGVNDCGPEELLVDLPSPTTARYIKLTILEQVWPGGYNNIAEINVLTQQ
jgi:uncharacterized protein YjdB